MSEYSRPASSFSSTITAEGKLVVGGYTSTSVYNLDLAVARFDLGGSLDSSFSDDGMVTAHFGVGDFADGVIEQRDGKSVAGGTIASAFTSSADMGLARFNSDGSPDTSFGTNGQTLVTIGGLEFASGLAVQSTGRIIWGGSWATSTAAHWRGLPRRRLPAPAMILRPLTSCRCCRRLIEPMVHCVVAGDGGWDAVDPEPSAGGVVDPPDTVADLEGTHVCTSDEVCDAAGNCATGSVEGRSTRSLRP